MAIAASLSVTAGVAFAANPFTDVPAKHWSYDAVAQLAKEGVVDGFNDGTFRGDKTITRYEMAVIVAKAMAKEQNANANTKAIIDKLAAEYSDELTNLGVRVSALEAKTGNVTITGNARVRYEKIGNIDACYQNQDRNLNLELDATAKVNDNWKVVSKFEVAQGLTGDVEGVAGDSDFANKKLYLDGNVAGGNLQIGKFEFKPGYAVTYDCDTTGVKYTFGNALKTTLFDGKMAQDNANTMDTVYNPWFRVNSDKIVQAYGAQLQYTFGNATNVSFLAIHAKNIDTNLSRNFYELGADTKVGKDFKLTGVYAKSNADNNKTAYLAQLTYNAADIKVKNSFDVFFGYAKNEAKSVLKPGNDLLPGEKGYQFGFEYVPMENTKLTAWYFKKNAIDAAAQGYDSNNKTRVQLEYFF